MAVARKMNAQYMECSSKEWTGVEEIFTEAINIVVANDRSNQQYQQEGGTGHTGAIRKKKRNCKIL